MKMKLFITIDPEIKQALDSMIDKAWIWVDKCKRMIQASLSSLIATIPFVGGFLAVQLANLIDNLTQTVRVSVTKAIEVMRIAIISKQIGIALDSVFKQGEFLGVTQLADKEWQNVMAAKLNAAQNDFVASTVTRLKANSSETDSQAAASKEAIQQAARGISDEEQADEQADAAELAKEDSADGEAEDLLQQELYQFRSAIRATA